MLTFHFSGPLGEMTVPEVLTAGTIGIQVRFTFSSEWEGLRKTVTFLASDGTDPKSCTLPLTGETATIPAAVLERPWHTLYVTVHGYGENGDQVLPSLRTKGPLIFAGENLGDLPQVDGESPAWYQTLSQMGALEDLHTLHKDTLVGAINEVYDATPYQYAREWGYSGTEAEFARLMTVLYITFTPGTSGYTTDKTFAQVTQALEAGQIVRGRDAVTQAEYLFTHRETDRYVFSAQELGGSSQGDVVQWSYVLYADGHCNLESSTIFTVPTVSAAAYYIPSVTQETGSSTAILHFTPSMDSMEPLEDVVLDLPAGLAGASVYDVKLVETSEGSGTYEMNVYISANGAAQMITAGTIQIPTGSGGGITPTIGENGNWYLGDEDTGMPSQGKSAYALAQEAGYAGTETDLAAKLAAGAYFTTTMSTAEDGTLLADHTLEEQYAAYLSGQVLICIQNAYLMTPVVCNERMIVYQYLDNVVLYNLNFMYGGRIRESTVRYVMVPSVSEEDNGKILTVVDGSAVWALPS